MKRNINTFSYHYKLKEMVIDDNINMEEIYDLIKTKIKYESKKDILYKDKIIHFYDIKYRIISFNLNDKKIARDILREPIKIKSADKSIEFEIICDSQIVFIRLQNNITEFLCKEENETYNLNILNLIEHSSHECILTEPFEFKIFLNQEEIKENLLKYNMNFLDKTFKTPEMFEKNFKYYFKYGTKFNLNKQFTIFEENNDNKRQLLVNDILKDGEKLFYNYYGASGKGKSITLIGALKYNRNAIDKNYGTFYVNCKALRILIDTNNFLTAKQIFIDEILFLFNEYENYKKCCEYIKDFNFNIKNDFWKLVEKILDSAFNIKKMYFIIAFDQYNSENDVNNELKRIQTKYFIYNNFKMLIFSSMNESDVRQIKMNDLLKTKSFSKYYENQEIKQICSNFLTHFNNEEQEAFDKLGKTFKSYNEIIQLRNNNSIDASIDQYISRKKNKITYKIFFFMKELKKEKIFIIKKISQIILSFIIWVKFLVLFQKHMNTIKKKLSKL